MDLPENERPRERLLKYGPEVLSNSELLAIILRTGTKKENIISLSGRILKKAGGINGLFNLTAEEFMKIDGIGRSKACQLLAVAEMSKRFHSYKSGNEYKICSPKDAANYVMQEMRHLKQEILRVIMLNTKNVIIKVKDVSLGSINSSIVHPREVFCEAIKNNSVSIIICHNHPSGNPKPSGEDINVTNRLIECGKIIGIQLIDHIIIGDGIYISLKEKGIV
ncbi:RadC family protein [Clostridium acetireducens]|jgi:DNA repair protein RadC|nr:DNA repair protein RadC [Clostridium acetireducens]